MLTEVDRRVALTRALEGLDCRLLLIKEHTARHLIASCAYAQARGCIDLNHDITPRWGRLFAQALSKSDTGAELGDLARLGQTAAARGIEVP